MGMFEAICNSATVSDLDAALEAAGLFAETSAPVQQTIIMPDDSEEQRKQYNEFAKDYVGKPVEEEEDDDEDEETLGYDNKDPEKPINIENVANKREESQKRFEDAYEAYGGEISGMSYDEFEAIYWEELHNPKSFIVASTPEEFTKMVARKAEKANEEVVTYCKNSAKDVYKGGGRGFVDENGKMNGKAINEEVDIQFTELATQAPDRQYEASAPKYNVRNETAYKPDTFMVNNKTVTLKNMGSEELSSKYIKKYMSADYIINVITCAFLRKFQSVNTVTVSGERVILNDIYWYPTFSEEQLENLPLDIASYLRDGALCYLIDWKLLLFGLKPKALSFDSADFAFGTVAPFFHKKRQGRVGTITFFNALPSLYALEIQGDTIKRTELNNPEAYEKMKKKSDKVHRASALFGGYTLSVTKGTSGLQNFAWKNLKTYATSRGNRGFLRYSVGTVARAGGLVAAGVVNLVAHLGKGIKDFAKGAVKPVSTDEIY